MVVQIKKGTIEQAIVLDAQIPEFDGSNRGKEYQERLKGKDQLILVASKNNVSVGFKVGYKEKDYFYSWMGGVLPDYRNNGIASLLAKHQENFVREMGISRIRFKTQNKFRSMLIFALKNGFSILGTVPYEGDEGFKILLEKKLI